MYHNKNILCLIALFSLCYATKKNPPLKQFEGPWIIMKTSENALPILGKCPSMEIEPSQEEPNDEGLIVFKSTILSQTLSVIKVDQKVYQIFYLNDSGLGLLGNVTLLHVEKSTFIITELQTEEQMYYAVLTKENHTTPETNKKIDKVWKSSTPAKSVLLAPTEYENCPDSLEEQRVNTESNISTNTKSTDVDQQKSSETHGASIHINISDKKPIAEVNNTPLVSSATDHQKAWIEEKGTTATIKSEITKSQSIPLSISISESSQTSTDNINKLPLVGGNDTTKIKSRNSANTNVLSSNYLSATLGLVLFYISKAILI